MRFFFLLLAVCFYLPVMAQPTDKELFEQGNTASREGRFEDAIGHYKKATELNASHGDAWYALAWVYNEVGEYENALKVLPKAKELLGQLPGLLFEYGYAYQNTNQRKEAIASYEECIALKNDYSLAYRQLATCYYEWDRDYTTALKYYQMHVKYEEPDYISSRSWYRKAYCEVEVGDFDAALNSINQSIVADSMSVDAWNEKGFILFEMGNADESIASFTRSIGIDTENSGAYKGIADVYRLLTLESDKAFVNYSKAVELNPEHPNNHFGLAWCYNDQKQFEKAIPCLQKAIELNGSEAAYHAELGYTYYGLQKYDLALAAIDRSLQLKELSYAIYYKGLVYIAQKDKKKAKEIQDKLNAMDAPEAPTLAKKLETL